MTTQESQTPAAGSEAPAPAPAAPNPPSGSPASTQTSETDLGTGEPLAGSDTDLGSADGAPSGEPAAPPPWAEFHGAPVDDAGQPADYGFTAPDGLDMDTELAAEFTPIARELNLSAKGAQKLVDLKAKDVKNQLERWGGHLKELKTSAMADPEVGGANYAPAIQRGKAVLKKFGDPELTAALNTYGLGAHRAMIRFLNKVANATGETATLQPGAGSGAATTKPLHELLYKDT